MSGNRKYIEWAWWTTALHYSFTAENCVTASARYSTPNNWFYSGWGCVCVIAFLFDRFCFWLQAQARKRRGQGEKGKSSRLLIFCSTPNSCLRRQCTAVARRPSKCLLRLRKHAFVSGNSFNSHFHSFFPFDRKRKRNCYFHFVGPDYFIIIF